MRPSPFLALFAAASILGAQAPVSLRIGGGAAPIENIFKPIQEDLLKVQGIDTVTFLLNDYKYPLVSQIYIVQTDTLTKERDKLKAFLTAEIMGWQANLKNPVLGATLAAKKYGKDQKLTVKEQTLESKSENSVILTSATATENGSEPVGKSMCA